MQALALLMIVGVTIVPYLSIGDGFGRMAVLPSSAKYVPELLGGMALLCVVALGIRDRFRFVRPAYWVIFGLLTICIASSAVANALDPGPLFSGIRAYLRAIPWFFVPAVFAFDEKQIRTQLKWMLGISLLQVPIGIEQRIHTQMNYYGFVSLTGDLTSGTFQFAGIFSIFLVSVACVIAAFTLKRQLPALLGFVLAGTVLVPTMINETKAMLIMLPFALFVTFQAAAKRGERLKRLVLASAVTGVFFAVFIPTYDYMQQEKPGSDENTIGKFLSGDNADRYLDSESGIGTTRHVGRVDSVRVATEETLTDPVRAVFGVGIGNTMESALGSQFSGKYYERYHMFTLETTFSTLVLELGFLGVGALLCVYWLIFRDALFVAEHGNPSMRPLGAAWAAITPLMALMLFYGAIHPSVGLSFLFWYFSGLVAADRARLAMRVAAPVPARIATEMQGAPLGRRAQVSR